MIAARTIGAILFIFAFANVTFAQAPDTLWTRTYGGCYNDFGRTLLLDSNGVITMVGESSSRLGGGADYLVWITSLTDTSSSHFFLGHQFFNYTDYPRRILQHTDTTLAIFGQMIPVGGTHHKFAFTIVSVAGDSLTNRLYGGLQGAHELLFETIPTESGYLMVGATGSFGSVGNWNFWAIEIDSSGDSLWSAAYGSGLQEFCRDVARFSNGNYILVGDRNNVEPYAPIFVVVSSSGDSITGGYVGTPGTSVYVHDVLMLPDDRFVIAYEQQSQSGLPDAKLLCADVLGNINWQLGPFSSSNDVIVSLGLGHSGNIIAVGNIGIAGQARDGWLLAISLEGDSLWSRSIGTSADEVFEDIVAFGDDKYFTLGHATTGCNDSWDFWLAAFGPEHGRLVSPNGAEQISVISTDTIRWSGVGFEGGVSIELNRHYPIGEWEVLADSTENDGEYEWFVTDPLSDSCRIRICALQDTFCDVSDGNFSIVSSQGYLALVRSSQPNTAVTSWNVGEVECPQTASQWFRLKNFGSEPIVVFQPPEPLSAEFSLSTTCGAFFVLAPGGISSCSLTVSFSPTIEGLVQDTLRIQTDAVNGINGFVSIPLLGSQIRTPESPEVVISTIGNNAVLNWSRIVESIGHCQIDSPNYLVFFSESQAGPFWFHGVTSDTAYTHVGAVQYASSMFYHVYAVHAEPGSLAMLPNGRNEARVSEEEVFYLIGETRIKHVTD